MKDVLKEYFFYQRRYFPAFRAIFHITLFRGSLLPNTQIVFVFLIAFLFISFCAGIRINQF